MESPTFRNNKGLTSNTVALPKGEGAFPLLPEGQGLGMRGQDLQYEVTAFFIHSDINTCGLCWLMLFLHHESTHYNRTGNYGARASR